MVLGSVIQQVCVCARVCAGAQACGGLRAPLSAVPQVPSVLCFEMLAQKSSKRVGRLGNEPQAVGSQHSIVPSFHTGIEFRISGLQGKGFPDWVITPGHLQDYTEPCGDRGMVKRLKKNHNRSDVGTQHRCLCTLWGSALHFPAVVPGWSSFLYSFRKEAKTFFFLR